MSGWKALALAAVSGVSLGLSLPPRDWEWLAWFGVAPLFIAAHRRRLLEACGLGLFAGVVCGAVQGSVSLPFLLLGLLLGGVAAFAAWTRPRHSGLAWVALVSCGGLAAEWLTTLLPIPIHLALSQYRNVPVLQLAAWTGIWGVSLLLWSVNAAIADAWILRRARGPALAVALAGAGAAWGLGLWVLHEARPGPLLRVAAIQDRPEILTSGDTLVSGGTRRITLTRQAASQGARLVVWPELSLGNVFDAERPSDGTRVLAKELGIYLAAGFDNRVGRKRYNSAALVAPDGRVCGMHHKIHLWLDEQGKDIGREARTFRTPNGTLGLLICFDTCFTDATRWSVRNGAQLIAMPNFDPPTRGGVLHRLHGAVLPFRAVENRVAFVRADWSGLSQVIDPYGRIVGQSELGRAEALIADVPLGDGRGTWFTRWGDWLALASLPGLGFWLLLDMRRRVQAKHSANRADSLSRVDSRDSPLFA